MYLSIIVLIKHSTHVNFHQANSYSHHLHPWPEVKRLGLKLDTWTVSKQAEGSTFSLGLRDMTRRVRDCLGC